MFLRIEKKDQKKRCHEQQACGSGNSYFGSFSHHRHQWV